MIHLKTDIKMIQNLWKGNEFVFDYVHLIYYECHKTNPNPGRSFIDSPDRIKNQKKNNNKSHQ